MLKKLARNKYPALFCQAANDDEKSVITLKPELACSFKIFDSTVALKK